MIYIISIIMVLIILFISYLSLIGGLSRAKGHTPETRFDKFKDFILPITSFPFICIIVFVFEINEIYNKLKIKFKGD